mgnify:CR=1 FL=1
MKDLKNTILEEISPKITWDDFIKACWSYFESKKDHINMYDVFDLPPRSRKGLPKVLPTAPKMICATIPCIPTTKKDGTPSIWNTMPTATSPPQLPTPTKQTATATASPMQMHRAMSPKVVSSFTNPPRR